MADLSLSDSVRTSPSVSLSLAVQGIKLGPRPFAFSNPQRTLKAPPFFPPNRRAIAFLDVSLPTSRELDTFAQCIRRSSNLNKNSWSVAESSSSSQVTTFEKEGRVRFPNAQDKSQLLFYSKGEGGGGSGKECLNTVAAESFQVDEWNYAADDSQIVNDQTISSTTVDTADEVLFEDINGEEIFGGVFEATATGKERDEMKPTAMVTSVVCNREDNGRRKSKKKKRKKRRLKEMKGGGKEGSKKEAKMSLQILSGEGQTGTHTRDAINTSQSGCYSREKIAGGKMITQRSATERAKKSSRQSTVTSLSTPNLQTARLTESRGHQCNVEILNNSDGKHIDIRKLILPVVGNGRHFPPRTIEKAQSLPMTTCTRQVVFLSQAQSAFLSSQGVHAAPPPSPTQEQLDKNIVLSLADCMARQTLTARITKLAKKACTAAKQEETKAAEEAKRREKEEEKQERERARARQRAEIYALNHAMAKLEEEQFQAFCQLQARREEGDGENLQRQASTYDLGV